METSKISKTNKIAEITILFWVVLYDYSKPFKGTIVSNGVVHDELVAIISAAEHGDTQ